MLHRDYISFFFLSSFSLLISVFVSTHSNVFFLTLIFFSFFSQVPTSLIFLSFFFFFFFTDSNLFLLLLRMPKNFVIYVPFASLPNGAWPAETTTWSTFKIIPQQPSKPTTTTTSTTITYNLFFVFILPNPSLSLTQSPLPSKSPCGTGNVPECNITVSEFELQLRFHFRTNNVEKGMNPDILPVTGYIVPQLFSNKGCFGTK